MFPNGAKGAKLAETTGAGDIRAPSDQPSPVRASKPQLRYLRHGLDAPGGKLPLFDDDGQEISPKTIRSCIEHGWAEPWFSNPVKPDWLVCRLTPQGRRIAGAAGGSEP